MAAAYRPGRATFTRAQRRDILTRDPICQAPGCSNPSTIADHIIADAFGGSSEIANGQGLCGGCHKDKTEAERLHSYREWRSTQPTQRRKPEAHPRSMIG